MKEFIISNLASQSAMSLSEALFKLFVSLVIGCAVYAAYYLTSPRVSYNGSFGISLVAMTIITTAIMAVISSNIALSLGMVGALSIIRFRTAIKDPRDAMFIFWSIMIGICCGVAQYIIALASTVVLFVFFLCAKAIRDDKRYILIIRCDISAMEKVKAITYKHFPTSRISVQNTNKESAEFIYELKHAQISGNSRFLKEIYACEGVECANFVLQEDTTNA